MDRLMAMVIRLRWPIVALFTVVTAAFALQLPRAQMDTEMKNQLPRDLPTRLNLDRIEEIFGGTDMAMIVLSADSVISQGALTRLQKLSAGMESLEYCQRVVGPFTAKDLQGDSLGLTVEPAIPAIPQSQAEQLALQERLTQNPLVHGNLISKDFRHAVALCFLSPDAKDAELIDALELIIEENPGEGEALVGGMPVTRVSLTRDMQKDMRRLLPAGLLVMLAFLMVCFRQARGVLLPAAMTVMAIVVAMGLIPLLGWKIHTVTVLLPVILIAVANDYGIHMVARYQEDNAPGNQLTPRELAQRGATELAFPVLATGVTTMIGMLCLSSHLVVPAKQLGVLAAVGVCFAMLGSLLFIPAVLSVLPKAKPVVDLSGAQRETGWLGESLAWVARVVPRHPKRILVTAAVVCVGAGAFTTRITVDTNPLSFYQQEDPIWRSTHLLNEHLGGWAGLSVVAEGDIKDPEVLREIDGLEQHLKKHPSVGTTTSMAGVMRKMNQVMHEGDAAQDVIPETKELVAQYLLLYTMSGSEEDFSKLVDFDYRHAQVMAKVTDSGTQAATDVVAYTKSYLAERPDGPLRLVGGLLDVMAELVHHIVWGQIESLAWAAGLTLLVVALLMRSLAGGILAVAPLLLALAMIFGVMGLTGVELNLVTALLSSIMIGVGVDYTIHFLWRYRDERAAGVEPSAAVAKTLATAGRGIIFNGVSVVIGFLVLAVSGFQPVRFFGLLVALSIFASLVAALVVVPALVLVFRPRFLEPRGGEAPPPKELRVPEEHREAEAVS